MAYLAGIAISTLIVAPTSAAEPFTPTDQQYCIAVGDYLEAKSVTSRLTCGESINAAKIGCTGARAERARGRDDEHVAEHVAENAKFWADSSTLALAIVIFGMKFYCPDFWPSGN